MQRLLAVFLVLGLGYLITVLFLIPLRMVDAWKIGFLPALFGVTVYLLMEMRHRCPWIELLAVCVWASLCFPDLRAVGAFFPFVLSEMYFGRRPDKILPCALGLVVSFSLCGLLEPIFR